MAVRSLQATTYDGLDAQANKTSHRDAHYYYNNQWRAVEERVDGASVPVDRQYTWGLCDRLDLLRASVPQPAALDEPSSCCATISTPSP